jgi:glycosyltransferase involved in cell wall biosynthesis
MRFDPIDECTRHHGCPPRPYQIRALERSNPENGVRHVLPGWAHRAARRWHRSGMHAQYFNVLFAPRLELSGTWGNFMQIPGDTMAANGTNLCLNMIVKNEVKNLQRCLSAVAPYLSCYVIGDTGSTDGTQDFIRSFFAARDIPGEVHSFPFINFAQARNEALERARASKMPFQYLLLTDADMELTVGDPAFSRTLTSAAYSVLQRSGVSYWNIRLLRRDVPAEYKGVTHEYLDVRTGETRNLDNISFIDHATGSNRVDKYERDARLLTDAIAGERDPGLIARYTFYLANTLRDSGQKEAALQAYLKRAHLGLWQQEVFVSLLNAAKLKEALNYSNDLVLTAYTEANAACPTRAEALHGAARFCRNKSLYERGYKCAVEGLAIAYPNDALFVEDWIYQYGLLDELAINAYWTGRYAECVDACDRLLSGNKLPTGMRDRISKNRDFAVGKLAEAPEWASPEAELFARLLRAAREKEQLSCPDDEIICAYLEAAVVSPMRAEALHGAARFCRSKGLHERGYRFADRGLTIMRPQDTPEAETWIYDYGLLDEFAVHAYWTGRYVACVEACDRLLNEGKLPTGYSDRILKNKQFAIDQLAAVASQKLAVDAARVDPDAPTVTLPAGRSFDLFDTLVARRCVHAHEIFVATERISGRAGFAQARLAAEAEIASDRYTLDDIYRRLAEGHGIPAEEANRLKCLELDVESANLFPIREHCREVGPNDVVVSDMYLPASWLMNVVQQTCGLAPRGLYVSSHGKRWGTVWQTIRQEMTLTEHVGDNPVTDQASAQRVGILARLSTVARRTEIEDELADAGFAPLANLIREARLTTWHDDPAFRRAQIAQTQLNFPLLFLSTLLLRSLSRAQRWDHILMSGRDCYLWHGLYQHLRSVLPDAPPATYFHTSRVTRAHPSPGYLAYFSAQCVGRRNVVVDISGTGWSLSRLIERDPQKSVAIFLLHKLEMPDVLHEYEKFGRLTRPISVHSVVTRAPDRYDSEVLERMNFAPHSAVEDVEDTSGRFELVLSPVTYPEHLATLILNHHRAFEHTCGLLRTLVANDIEAMSDNKIAAAIEAIYRRLAGILLPQFEAFGPYKAQEERRAREALEKNTCHLDDGVGTQAASIKQFELVR